MSDLKNKATRIKNEKDSKIIPENIKKGVKIFDVTGSYEPPSISGAKVFTTKQEMEDDSTATDGDLALVYGEVIVELKQTDHFDTLIFPNRVVLDTEVTSNIFPSFEIDGDDMFEGDITLEPEEFRFMLFDDYRNDVTYRSEDGITYIKEQGPSRVSLGYTIHNTYGWDDRLGKFINIPSLNFEGSYVYNNSQNIKYIVGIDNFIDGNEPTYTKTNIYFPSIIRALNRCISDYMMFINTFSSGAECSILYNKNTGTASVVVGCGYLGFDTELNKFIFLDESIPTKVVYEVDVLTGEILNMETLSRGDVYTNKYTGTYSKYYEADNQTYIFLGMFSYSLSKMKKRELPTIKNEFDTYTSNTYQKTVTPDECGFAKMLMWHPITNGLTATTGDVYNARFYGRDGIEDGALVTNIDSAFFDYNAMLYNEMLDAYNNLTPATLDTQYMNSFVYAIPVKYDGTVLLDTSHITNFSRKFQGAYYLKYMPKIDTSNATDMTSMFVMAEGLKGVARFDTSNVTNMSYMFVSCIKLEDVPVFDTSKVTNMDNMFQNCRSLNDNSLNNILLMCANSRSSSKTLSNIGLTSEQANRCTTLSNYSIFVSAGWTTGY